MSTDPHPHSRPDPDLIDALVQRNADQGATIGALQNQLDVLRRGGLLLRDELSAMHARAERNAERIARLTAQTALLSARIGAPAAPVPWVWRPARALSMLLTGR